jgi:hypothetical protein
MVSKRDASRNLPPEFMMELAIASMEDRGLSAGEKCPKLRPKCFYHDHKGEDDKCK